uniref:Uncharacterized protein n=1 Tax=Cucumis melo TaxID=3656 RepID=A0A9I9EM81_CUCME
MATSGQWLEKALDDLCKKMETGWGLDKDMISGLVSYCELAQPQDAKEYLDICLFCSMNFASGFRYVAVLVVFASSL